MFSLEEPFSITSSGGLGFEDNGVALCSRTSEGDVLIRISTISPDYNVACFTCFNSKTIALLTEPLSWQATMP